MKEKIIVITGGASGLGLELVKQSIARGLYVCNIDWNVSKMKELEETYKTGYKGFIGDISDEDFIKEEKNLKIVNVMSSAALRGNKQEAVYCATKWGEKGYTESLKIAYKGTSVKIIGVYPGGINTNFYKNSRDYISEEKQNSFMNPRDVADTILNNILSPANLTVADIIIERNS